MSKRIPLTKGLFATVDDRDFDRLTQGRKWQANWNPVSGIYAARGEYVRQTKTRRWYNRTVRMHELIMGRRPGFTVDHKDRNKLNNRRSNLRWATFGEQMANRSSWGKLGFRGVYPNSWGGFEAAITFGKKRRYLGRFSNVEDAARAYDAAARELHGEFAVLNFSN